MFMELTALSVGSASELLYTLYMFRVPGTRMLRFFGIYQDARDMRAVKC